LLPYEEAADLKSRVDLMLLSIMEHKSDPVATIKELEQLALRKSLLDLENFVLEYLFDKEVVKIVKEFLDFDSIQWLDVAFLHFNMRGVHLQFRPARDFDFHKYKETFSDYIAKMALDKFKEFEDEVVYMASLMVLRILGKVKGRFEVDTSFLDGILPMAEEILSRCPKMTLLRRAYVFKEVHYAIGQKIISRLKLHFGPESNCYTAVFSNICKDGKRNWKEPKGELIVVTELKLFRNDADFDARIQNAGRLIFEWRQKLTSSYSKEQGSRLPRV